MTPVFQDVTAFTHPKVRTPTLLGKQICVPYVEFFLANLITFNKYSHWTTALIMFLIRSREFLDQPSDHHSTILILLKKLLMKLIWMWKKSFKF